MLQRLDPPGCAGRRNCNVNLDNRRWDRPDLDCEPQQARGIPSQSSSGRDIWDSGCGALVNGGKDGRHTANGGSRQRRRLVRGECGCGGEPAPLSRSMVRAWLGIPRRWKHGGERVKRWRGLMSPAPNGNGPTWMTLRRSWSRWARSPKSMRGSLSGWRWSANTGELRRAGAAPTAEGKRVWPSRGCSSGAKRWRRSQSWQGWVSARSAPWRGMRRSLKGTRQAADRGQQDTKRTAAKVLLGSTLEARQHLAVRLRA